MGFEDLPAKPTRDDELKMIKKYEDEFKAQPSYKWYMNEAPRDLKLKHSYDLNNYKYNWMFNFGLGLLFSGPAIIYLDKFWRNSTSGAPYFFRPKFFYVTFNHYIQYRRYKSLSIQIPLWVFSGMTYAYWFTNRSKIDDETYERTKLRRML